MAGKDETSGNWRIAHGKWRKRAFDWRGTQKRFSSDDAILLRDWGAWMLALWSGELVPQTDAQRKFIEATHDRVPTTTWEESVFRIFLQHAGVAKFRTHNAYLARQAGIVEAQLRDNDESALGVHRTLTDAQASREWGVDDALLDSGDVVRSDSAYQPELDAELDGDCAEPVSDRDSDAATFDDET